MGTYSDAVRIRGVIISVLEVLARGLGPNEELCDVYSGSLEVSIIILSYIPY